MVVSIATAPRFFMLSKYRDDTWEAPQRAARLSAAVKRYKTYEMLYFFFQIADEAGLDYTPLVVKRLCAHLFDSSRLRKSACCCNECGNALYGEHKKPGTIMIDTAREGYQSATLR